jgi:predicted nucleic acid-binding protein
VSIVYDAAVLVGADRNHRDLWADHRMRLEIGLVPITTAPVVAQVSRAPRQVQLRRFLRGCDIVAFSPQQAHEVGDLVGEAGTADVVDAHVAVTARTTNSAVLTADLGDLQVLSDAMGEPIPLRGI